MYVINFFLFICIAFVGFTEVPCPNQRYLWNQVSSRKSAISVSFSFQICLRVLLWWSSQNANVFCYCFCRHVPEPEMNCWNMLFHCQVYEKKITNDCSSLSALWRAYCTRCWCFKCTYNVLVFTTYFFIAFAFIFQYVWCWWTKGREKKMDSVLQRLVTS